MPRELKNIVRNCKEATLISIKKEQGKISFSESIQLFIHLLFCDGCKQFIRQSAIINRSIARLVGRLQHEPTHRLSLQIRQKIQEEIEKSIK